MKTKKTAGKEGTGNSISLEQAIAYIDPAAKTKEKRAYLRRRLVNLKYVGKLHGPYGKVTTESLDNYFVKQLRLPFAQATSPTAKAVNLAGLEVFDSTRSRHRLDAGISSVQLGQTVATLSAKAVETMGLQKGDRMVIARNPADGSVYVGVVVSPDASIRGFHLCNMGKKKISPNFTIRSLMATGKVARGRYEIAGPKQVSNGVEWYPLMNPKK